MKRKRRKLKKGKEKRKGDLNNNKKIRQSSQSDKL